MATLINGADVARMVKNNLYRRSKKFQHEHERKPCLAVILVGSNPASQKYVKAKNQDCEDCDILCSTITFPENTPEKVVRSYIKNLNYDDNVDGILVQMPLPKHIDENAIKAAISPAKDVDCFTPQNAGRMWTKNDSKLKPCTPSGIVTLLKETVGAEWCAGKHAVVIGRSNIVGRPIADMLLDLDMTVTVCHSKTKGLSNYTKSANLIVSAAGKTGLLSKDMVKPDAIVIDVSMNVNANGKLCGDCDPTVHEVAGFITPVPGGVGPMTRAELMRNVLIAAEAIEENKR